MEKLREILQSAGAKTAARQLLLTMAALLTATIFLAATGFDPFAILRGIYGSLTHDLAGTIRWATPLILAGLAVCVTFKAKIFNLGVDGQIALGATAATAVALTIPVQNSVVGLAIIFAAAIIAGMLFALIPALLKVFFDTNEVVSTLLLNFIAALFVDYLVAGPMREPGAMVQLNASAFIPEHLWLPRLALFHPSAANIGVYFAIVLAIVIAFCFKKTTLGFDIKMTGENKRFAQYSGIEPHIVTLKTFAISGGIAGIIGAIEVTAIQRRLLSGFNPGFGFDGIVVSLLAGNNPLGVIFSGLFLGSLRNGGINMERMTDVPSSVTEIVMGIIILTISANFVLPRLWKKLKQGDAEGLAGKK